MKLSQALKLKNRLAGELSRLQNILFRENSRRSDNPSKVNQADIWIQIQKISDELGELKAKIAAANIGIYSAIERMAELKSRITYIATLPKRDTPDIQLIGRDQEKVEYTWTPFINQQMADELTSQYQKQCDKLQDKIDTYNATTDI